MAVKHKEYPVVGLAVPPGINIYRAWKKNDRKFR